MLQSAVVFTGRRLLQGWLDFCNLKRMVLISPKTDKKTPNLIKMTHFNIYIFSPFSWPEYGARILQRGVKAAGYIILFFIFFVVILLFLASSCRVSDSNCNLWMVAFEFLEPYGELSYIVTPVFWSTYMA